MESSLDTGTVGFLCYWNRAPHHHTRSLAALALALALARLLACSLAPLLACSLARWRSRKSESESESEKREARSEKREARSEFSFGSRVRAANSRAAPVSSSILSTGLRSRSMGGHAEATLERRLCGVHVVRRMRVARGRPRAAGRRSFLALADRDRDCTHPILPVGHARGRWRRGGRSGTVRSLCAGSARRRGDRPGRRRSLSPSLCRGRRYATCDGRRHERLPRRDR